MLNYLWPLHAKECLNKDLMALCFLRIRRLMCWYYFAVIHYFELTLREPSVNTPVFCFQTLLFYYLYYRTDNTPLIWAECELQPGCVRQQKQSEISSENPKQRGCEELLGLEVIPTKEAEVSLKDKEKSSILRNVNVETWRTLYITTVSSRLLLHCCWGSSLNDR